MNTMLCLIIVYNFVLNWAAAEDIDLGRIIFSNILYRHGDRTPVECYPKDPYNNETSWPVPYGQLTNLGKNQHLLLGRWFRNRYFHMLTTQYVPSDIYIQSTDVDRTLMSAEANLAGLYPPQGKQIWNHIKWMPIPVHTIPESMDYVLAAMAYCPRYEYELEKFLKSPEMKQIDKENKKLYIYLTNKTGKKVSSLRTAEQIYDVLFIESLYNKTLPEWTKEVFPGKLKPLAEKSFTINAGNTILQRLKSGSLLGEMVNHMVQKSKNALVPDRKIWMYSAHDETVANMLMTLGVFDQHCPPYTATILIELRINYNKQYFVTISYKNTTDEPSLLTLPGCLTLCPLSQFVALTKHVIPDDWEKECLQDWEKYEYKVNTTAVVGKHLNVYIRHYYLGSYFINYIRNLRRKYLDVFKFCCVLKYSFLGHYSVQKQFWGTFYVSVILTTSILMLILLVLSIIGFIYWHYKKEHNQYYLRLTTDPI